MPPLRVLVAPDKFRGTIGAAEAAAALARGWRDVRPDDAVEEVPLADGGEGTLDVLLAAAGGTRRAAPVTGPAGEPLEAEYGLLPEGRAVVEMARASGLELVPEDLRDPKVTTSRGTGELILAACRAGAREVVVTIGGSATNDGGAGMARALGVRFLDGSGMELGPGGAELRRLASVDASPLAAEVRDARILVASDVDNPLTGPRGASAVYGPQKGATPEDVELLDRALGRLAEVVVRDLGIDCADAPGAGAAGGLGFGLMAFLHAELRSGLEIVMEAVGFERHLGQADLVVTGEGKIDEQSVYGKTPAGVLRVARERGVPVVFVCGQATVDPEGVPLLSLAERFGLDRALHDTAAALEDVGRELAERAEELVRA